MAGRYANALFELAREAGAIDRVMKDLDGFAQMLAQNADLRRLVASPVFGAEDQGRAIAAILERAGIGGLTASFFGLVAKNRRLFAIGDMIAAYRRIVAASRGESTAEVTSAVPLDAGQIRALKAAIRERLGTDVQIDAKVDESLLGGLVVKVGSRQIDTTLRSKLNNLKIALKEVG